jgi:hypothetical protein
MKGHGSNLAVEYFMNTDSFDIAVDLARLYFSKEDKENTFKKCAEHYSKNQEYSTAINLLHEVNLTSEAKNVEKEFIKYEMETLKAKNEKLEQKMN